LVFKAADDTVEEAILNSLVCAEKSVGMDGHTKYSLKEFIKDIL
jgi:D-aminopeptidase